MPAKKEGTKLDIPGNVIANMEWLRMRQGLSIGDIAAAMSICRNTYFTRKSNPGSLTLKEVALAARVLKTPARLIMYGALAEQPL